jgi:poly(A) polymerase
VRDLLLGRAAKDYDVATTATPEQVREVFGKRRTLAVGQSFGVIIVLAPEPAPAVEVATFRSEGDYRDGRRPSRVEFCTPEEDARRRDFTINGMFYDPLDSRVLDYVGGERDLAAGLVRAIGDPHDRMREDKLRLLRAVRFTAVLEFRLDEQTAAAVRDMAGELPVVSAERIAQELKRMLVDQHRRRAVELCLELGLLAVILPELNSAEFAERREQVLRALALLVHPTFELAMAALLQTVRESSVARSIGRRLRLSTDECERIAWLVSHRDELLTACEWKPARMKRLFSTPAGRDLLTFTRANLLAAGGELHPVLYCEEYLAHTPPRELNPPPLLTGDDLVQLGWSPGPHFKEVLDQVRDAQLNGEIATRDEALQLAARQRG